MQKDSSPAAKVFYMICSVVLVVMMMRVAFGWSINLTRVYMDSITGPEYGRAASWLVQLFPIGCIAVALIAFQQGNKKLGVFLLVVGLIFNLVDMVTNVGAFYEQWLSSGQYAFSINVPKILVDARYYGGLTFAFLTTWFEELMIVFMVGAAGLFLDVLNDYNKKVPQGVYKFFGMQPSGRGGQPYQQKKQKQQFPQHQQKKQPGKNPYPHQPRNPQGVPNRPPGDVDIVGGARSKNPAVVHSKVNPPHSKLQ